MLEVLNDLYTRGKSEGEGGEAAEEEEEAEEDEEVGRDAERSSMLSIVASLSNNSF